MLRNRALLGSLAGSACVLDGRVQRRREGYAVVGTCSGNDIATGLDEPHRGENGDYAVNRPGRGNFFRER
ncbi:hypothetical protein [Actinomadura sp. 21ATH]|uniref:hypothetical protein n=1 Tax=Actinomadura sp. 21ATH TaxID=1735444 RepID=UPI0035C2619E